MQDNNEWQVAAFPSDLDFCWEETSSAGGKSLALDDFGLGPTPALDWNHGLYLNSAPELHRVPPSNETSRLQGASRSSAKQQQLIERANGKPPPGCAPDAIKLFVGNLPRSCTEPQLLPFFESVGKIIDIVIVRDKATRESKGSAFIWYQKRSDAEQAISQFNMRYIFPDPTGKQTRPLALRKAQATHQPLLSHVNQWTPVRSSTLGEAPTEWLMQSGQGQGQAQAQARHLQLPTSSPPPSNWGSVHGAAPLQASAAPMSSSNPTFGLLHSGLPPAPNMSDMHASAHIMNSLAQVYGIPQVSGQNDGPEAALGLDSLLAHAGLRAQADNQRATTATIDITKEQLVTLSEFMHRVRSVSGATLHVSPGNAAGVFSLFLLGSQLQVDAARMLLSRILGPMN